MLRNNGETDNDSIIDKNCSSEHLKIDNLMTDNAVFQHGVSNIISGYADPYAFVQADFNGGTYSIIASDTGRFTIRIPAMSPAENLELVITSNNEKRIFRNIAIGNIYICAGQSNMVFKMQHCVPGPESLSEKDYEGIRYFKIPVRTYYGKQTNLPGEWISADRDSAPDFSGIAFFFAHKLYQDTKIPVGIIDASIGGVNMEAWLSRKTLFKMPEYRQEMIDYEKTVSVRDASFKNKMPTLGDKLNMKISELFPENPEDCGEKLGFFKADFDDSDWDEMYCPDPWTQAGHNHAGLFWFRKDIELPEGAENLSFTLAVGAIDKEDKTYVNGKLVGYSGSMRDFGSWNVKRIYSVPAGTFKAGKNNIAVFAASLVSICEDGGLIGPAENMFLRSSDGSININLAGQWKYRETFDAGTEGMTCMRSFGQGCANSFHIFYDNMILPMTGIAVKGIVWYQGEANTICMAHTYRKLLCGMISDWRDVFENDDLHFYVIQLPNFNTPHYFAPHSQWARVREAQQQACLDTNSDCIVTIGFGDINDLHPQNKKAVSEIIAEKEFRRLQSLPSVQTPVFESMTCSGNALILKFSGEALAPDPKGFAIAAKDMQACAAQAELIDDHTIKVYAPRITDPVAVWYAWADNPKEHTLKSVSGEPVSPFRAEI